MPGGQSGGENGVEKVVSEAVAVGQLIYPVCLSFYRFPEGDEALVGNGGEEALGFLSAAARFFQLPADDACRPLSQLVPY